MKAVGYVRVSGRGQLNGDGPERQLAAIREYAEANGIEIVAVQENAVTGTSALADREGLETLLQQTGVEAVLVERPDRLARDLIVGELMIAELKRRGVQVIACDGAGNLTAADEEPTRRLIRQILGALAEWNKNELVVKLRAGRRRKRVRFGKCEGLKAFGELPGEKETLARVKELWADWRGGSVRGFQRRLNALEIPARSGKPWSLGSVQRLVARFRGAAQRT